ncbi:MBL fold metallo-hydrolase [Patescibacteria group bacterium]|nr:MBL fold metallo-hydrolase [Patescibacteria group bacterium]
MANTIQFLGAAGVVTGSSYLVSTDSAKFLIDCGLFQGAAAADRKNYQSFPYNPTKINFLILTHAHLDHCGLIPKLYRDGFRGRIYTTPATFDLAQAILTNAAQIQEHGVTDKQLEALFIKRDATNSFKLFETHEYGKTFSPMPGIKVRLNDAGHILGAAIVEVWIQGQKLVFSGDLGNSPVPIMKDPTIIRDANYVICESTYGDRLHEPPSAREKNLLATIKQAARDGAKLIIPSFALERSQDLLYTLNNFRNSGVLPNIPVILDSPLASQITDIFKRYTKLFDADFQRYLKTDKDLFDFPGFRQTRTKFQSKALNQLSGAAVIIAGSGMADAGRVQHHLLHHLDEPRTQVLFVGFQTPNTLGRRLINGARQVRIMRHRITVKAQIKELGAFSAHADQAGLLRWLSGFTSKPTVFLTHGENISREALAKKVLSKLKLKAVIPAMGEIKTI